MLAAVADLFFFEYVAGDGLRRRVRSVGREHGWAVLQADVGYMAA